MKLDPAPALAAAFVLLFAVAMGAAWLAGDRELARQLSQGLLNILIAVSGFYFGSSRGSQAKDATIAAALKPAGAVEHSEESAP